MIIRLSRLNYRTLIGCLRRNGLERARRSNDRVLAVLPNNLIGLWGRTEFSAVAKTLFDYPMDYGETLAKLKRVARDDEKEVLIAKAGVAAMYRMVGTGISSNALDKSCRLYDEVFDEVNRLPFHVICDPVFRDLMATWKLDLSLNYHFQAMIQKPTDARNGASELNALYDKITLLLKPVADDERIADKIRADSLVLLATARDSHVRLTSSSSDRLHDDVTSFDWLKRAGRLDPDNLDTSLKIARHMRRGATTVKEIKNVIERLKLCLEDVRKRKIACHHLGLAYRSLWKLGDNFPPPPPPPRNRLRPPRGSSSLPIGSRVVEPPRSLLNQTMIPKPYKSVPRFLLLRHSNPLAGAENDAYLLEARRYFKRADNWGGGSDSLMLVEIARTYVSTGNIAEAERCFSRALERQNIASGAVYLFEQMGILKESQLNDDDDDDDHYNEELEDLKSIYREAIRHDTHSTYKAEMAYYRLLDILYYQTQASRANFIVQSEYFLIYMALQKREEYHNAMAKAMISDENQIGFMWRLIELLHQRNDAHDASAAFAYISVLAANDKLLTEVRGTELSVQDKLKILLDSGEKIALERPVRAHHLPQTFDWLCQMDDAATGVGGFPGMRSIAVIVDEIDTENLATVRRILARQLKRKYLLIISISDDTEIDELIVEVRKCHSVVVITDEIHRNSKLFRMMEAIRRGGNCGKDRSCLAVFDDSNSSNNSVLLPYLPEWRVESVVTSPKHDLDVKPLSSSDRCKINEIKNACRLLRALFKH